MGKIEGDNEKKNVNSDSSMISKRDVARGKVLVSVCAIIQGEEHEILWIYEGDLPYHKWLVMPGGYVKPDETIGQAVVREVKEETGINISPKKLLGIYEDFLSENDEPVHHIILAYETKVVGGRIVFSQEASAYRWLTLKEALSSAEIPDVFKRVLEDFGNGRERRFSLRKLF